MALVSHKTMGLVLVHVVLNMTKTVPIADMWGCTLLRSCFSCRSAPHSPTMTTATTTKSQLRASLRNFTNRELHSDYTHLLYSWCCCYLKLVSEHNVSCLFNLNTQFMLSGQVKCCNYFLVNRCSNSLESCYNHLSTIQLLFVGDFRCFKERWNSCFQNVFQAL